MESIALLSPFFARKLGYSVALDGTVFCLLPFVRRSPTHARGWKISREQCVVAGVDCGMATCAIKSNRNLIFSVYANDPA